MRRPSSKRGADEKPEDGAPAPECTEQPGYPWAHVLMVFLCATGMAAAVMVILYLTGTLNAWFGKSFTGVMGRGATGSDDEDGEGSEDDGVTSGLDNTPMTVTEKGFSGRIGERNLGVVVKFRGSGSADFKIKFLHTFLPIGPMNAGGEFVFSVEYRSGRIVDARVSRDDGDPVPTIACFADDKWYVRYNDQNVGFYFLDDSADALWEVEWDVVSAPTASVGVSVRPDPSATVVQRFVDAEALVSDDGLALDTLWMTLDEIGRQTQTAEDKERFGGDGTCATTWHG